jgi:hypothetical protein
MCKLKDWKGNPTDFYISKDKKRNNWIVRVAKKFNFYQNHINTELTQISHLKIIKK